MSQSTIREEFEKALYKEYPEMLDGFCEDIALWAAKWMAERCAKVAISNDHRTIVNGVEVPCECAYHRTAKKIRKLAQELQ